MCKKKMTDIVQYIFVRHDILRKMQWSIGAMIAQTSHATVAAMHIFADDPTTQEYLADLDNMHKVVLELTDEAALKKLVAMLEENKILHKVWIEQPENLATCVALKPYRKQDIVKYVSKYKLYRTTIID